MLHNSHILSCNQRVRYRDDSMPNASFHAPKTRLFAVYFMLLSLYLMRRTHLHYTEIFPPFKCTQHKSVKHLFTTRIFYIEY